MSDNIAVKVDGVSKTFRLPHEKQSSIKSILINTVRGGARSYELQKVLSDVSFEIKRGEFFGIVGRNGSGKSTLLKLLAGIYTPTSGTIHLNGKLTPFIELGVGFNPELTGRENVYLNGALLGFNRREMDGMYDEIVTFAELAPFMDQKLKNYSSGMQVRLAFSIAIRSNSDILLFDEVLAVGDEAFQKKCNDYFETVKNKDKTIILVTHSMEAVRRYCSKAMLIENGTIKILATPEEVANQYQLDNLSVAANTHEAADQNLGAEVTRLDVKPVSPLNLTRDQSFEFEIEYELAKDLEVALGIAVMFEGRSIIEHNTKDLTLGHKKNTPYSVRYTLPLGLFNPKSLSINIAIFEKEDFRLIGYNSNSCNFMVTGPRKKSGGLMSTKGEWRVGTA